MERSYLNSVWLPHYHKDIDMKAVISYELRKRVLERDGNRCRYCGTRQLPFHMDHVYPESKGGETTFENLVTSCASCNHRKMVTVGMWPKPVGYFDTNKLEPILYVWFYVIGMALVLVGAILSDYLH